MDRLVALAVNRRFLMVGMFVAVLIGGLIAFNQLNIEAYPDPTPPMVDIVTQSPGLSAEEIERYITIPIETQVAGLKNITTIRTISLYGLSDVKIQFSFAYTYDEALQQVLNRLAQLAPAAGQRAAADFAAQPDRRNSSAIASSVRPTTACSISRPSRTGSCSAVPLRAWRDRRHRLGWQEQDLRDPGRFQQARRQRPDAAQMLQAVGNANVNVGGNTVNIGQQSAVVRGASA